MTASAAPSSSDGPLLQTGHLIRCRRCGELNGRSADNCWSCEAELQSGTLPTGFNSLLPAAANSDTPPSLLPDLPVLTSSVNSSALRRSHGSAAQASFSAPFPSPSARRGPGLGLIAAMVAAVVMLVGGGVYFYVDAQESETAARATADALARARAAAARATLAAPTPDEAVPAPAPGDGLSAVDAALRAADQVDSVPAYVEPTEHVSAASARAKPEAGRAGRAHHAARSVVRSAAGAPTHQAVPTARSSSATASACAPNVAALGLCGAASSQAKE